jgi:glyoxylase I family protein
LEVVLKVKVLAHVCFYVEDLIKTYDFYVKIIGLKHVFDFTNEKGDSYGYFLHAGGRTFLEFFQGDYDPHASASCRHICFEVESLIEAKEQLMDHGIEMSNLKKGKDNVSSGIVHDPDGNIVEFHEYSKDSLQWKALR